MAEVKISVKNVVEGQNEVPKAAKNYEALNKNINTIAASMTAVIAAGATFKKAFDLSREGASLGQLSSSFELLNKNVLHTPGLLNAMSEAARGTIKETDLMAGVLTLTAGQSADMAQQFANASPKLIEIAKAAQKLNPTLGDTGFLYNSLATGIKRSSPLILDNLGIVVKIGDANEKYAASLGKSVEQLTAQEKQVALLNATLAAGDTLIEQVGGNVDSQTDAWDRLSVKIGTGTDAFKQNLAEGLMPWIQLVNGDYAKAIREIEEGNVRAAESTNDYTKAQTVSKAGHDAAVASILKTSSSYKEFTGKLDAAGISISNVHTSVGGMNEQWYKGAKATSDFNEAVAHTYATLASQTTPAIINNYQAVGTSAEAMLDARVQAIALNDAFHDIPEDAYAGAAKAIERVRDNTREAAIAERALQEAARDTAAEFEKQKAASEVMRNAEFISAYTDALNDSTAVTQLWTADADAMNQTLFDQIAANSDNAIAITSAGIALGLYDEAQIETALNAAIITEKINQLAASFVAGDITAAQMKSRMDEIVASSPYTSEIEVLTAEAIAAIDKARNKLKELDGMVVHSKVQVTTEYSGGPPGGGSGSDGGGGAPSRAVTGPVMANQPYLVHANEIFVPPTAGRIESANGLGKNQSFNISFSGAIFQGTTQQQAASMVSMVAEELGRL